MIVSTFELLIKRIATVPVTTPASISTVFRRAVEGYFLSISNLQSDRSIRLALRINISADSGNRVISTANTQCFFDVNSTNNSVLALNEITTTTPNIKVFQTQAFNIPARQTGLITVLPNVIPFLFPVNVPNPDLEIRGFIELVQVRTSIFLGVPASEVLTTPETRGTFLDNDYPTVSTTNELDFDQIAYSLPNASGKALNTVEAIPRFILDGPLVIDTFDPIKFRKLNLSKLPEAEIEEFIKMVSEMKTLK